ncbi:polysaccharide export protein EpsE [Duganella sp. BJB488]|uniref:polysaccharide export protein EpsE n=1 Tax=unclassified Duganella TaxID=2636909 RepID=UPI000E34ED3F|nr:MULTISPECIES: polysaccharide export protein EpsE [unclassified Duganella]NVD73920.1 polysaccharide export protein EpsE [Duganella sp. BJB1802]RFP12496.1 polysaccharide export protein EpsE [Duganella sp. BJB489]RFP16612.1 polysaccharide export protein EpsE [Duganella sp. BJB488]RFP30859.1 polysaccharide export protein EpsE [Duganella sp. BJB480]
MKKLMKWLAALALLSAVGSAAADAVLGPGDVLKITVYNNPDLTTETRVSDAGTVTFPLLGPVEIGGLTSAGAEKKLGGLLESGGFLRKAQVNILITQIQNQQVSVLGQVNRPGRYPIEGRRSVLDLLALAGGIAPEGSDTVSLIRKRNGATTKESIDVVGMVRSGQLANDFELSANDVLYVERAPRFYIYGEVQRPGPFRLERGMTVLQALSTGGGLTARGTERGLIIKRRDANGKQQVIDVKQDDLVQTDDVVYVKESLF